MTPDTTPTPFPENPPLSALEARALGCLIEKEFTTPDVYPLSLNALVNACNQRNNRHPILSVGAREVELALDQLRQRRIASLVAGADARVPKFRQTLDISYPLDPISRALLGELLLRGPQTAASLRANAERMQPMPDAAEIDRLLNDMAERPAGALIRRLPRQAGQKELRWVQLFTGEPAESAAAASPAESGRQAPPLTVSVSLPPEAEARFAALEAEVAQLKAELKALRESLGGS
ncbi:DUF480 domain-containing protein [Opitutaceae bacterium EW11]|nr:DUF480 domain-containing protein [Opitutaceae bacterium EW11]